jgi:hypothetical protein
VSGNLELVVAAGKTRLFRFSLETLTSTATISSDMASPVEYPLVIECDATARLCYWSRDTQREVWRDDFSERVAAVEFPGWVDPRTGRAVGPWVRTSRTDGSSGEGPGTPLYQVVERVDGPPRPMGVRASSLRHVAWSSREGEIILEAGGVFVLRLSDLTITPLPDTGSPIAVGSDGRILGVGPYSEIVVWSPELVEERRIYPRGCDHERIVRLEAQPGDEAREERLELEDRCNDFSPSLLAPAPSSSFVAMDSGGDELWVLDYARGRWTEHYGDLWRLVNHRRLDGLLWPATGDELFVVGTGQHFLVRRGSRGAEPSDLGDIVAAMASDGQGTFALSTDEGVLHFRTGTAETTLRLPFTPSAILAGPDAQWVAVGGRDAALVANGTVVARYRVGRSEGRSDVCWSGPQPVLATRDDAGGLLLTRLRDGRQLSIALVPHEGRLFAIARSDAAFSAPPEVRELVHLRLGATDLLAPTASAASVLEPALVESFLREPDPGQSSGGVAGAASGGLAP